MYYMYVWARTDPLHYEVDSFGAQGYRVIPGITMPDTAGSYPVVLMELATKTRVPKDLPPPPEPKREGS